MSLLTAADHRLLLDLLALPTAGPLETAGRPVARSGAPAPFALREAQQRYARAAADLGFRVLHHAPAPAGCLDRDGVPVTVRHAAAADPGFLDSQPSLVLGHGHRAGGPPDRRLRRRTVMFNVHLDTVAGVEPVGFDGTRFSGRGAVDAKGPAVALLAGLRAYLAGGPRPACAPAVLVQAVAGEEGGALGTFGTRPLVEAGYHGRLNVFCEPTGGRACPRSTAAMTARITVGGCDAIDDRPGAGHNATVLLGFLAQFLADALDRELAPDDGQVCVAGLHTGTLHNRVYGTGGLLLNLSYAATPTARRLQARLGQAVAAGLAAFAERFGGSARFGRTAADAVRVTRVEWLKCGLPALGSQPEWGARLLDAAGVPPWPPGVPGFTTDAIWMADVPDTWTVVLGPGDLTANRAHAAGEFADLADLEAFAAAVPRILDAFHADCHAGCHAAIRAGHRGGAARSPDPVPYDGRCPLAAAARRPRSDALPPHVPLAGRARSPRTASDPQGTAMPPPPPMDASADAPPVPAPVPAPAPGPVPAARPQVLVGYDDLLAAVCGVFAALGVPRPRALRAAEALCHGDVTGMSSHGLANLARLYVPLFDAGRVVPDAEPEIVSDRGAALLLDARGALGLWAAGAAMDLAVERAAAHGVGLVSVRGGTHVGCLGPHALRAVCHGMIGLVTTNCGRQRIARPPGGAVALLGTNPIALAAPAGPHHPFVLDMSTTTAPTGRVRAAARAGLAVPGGWLSDEDGHDVTDPAAFDRGQAHLTWLGGRPDTGAYKGYGLGLLVEVLSALVGGAGFGPAPEALRGDGRPGGRDDDIGYLVAAIAPARLRDADAVEADAASLFGTLLACPPTDASAPVGYPGHAEAERAARRRAHGVPVDADDFAALRALAAAHGLTPPDALPRPEPRTAAPDTACPGVAPRPEPHAPAPDRAATAAPAPGDAPGGAPRPRRSPASRSGPPPVPRPGTSGARQAGRS